MLLWFCFVVGVAVVLVAVVDIVVVVVAAVVVAVVAVVVAVLEHLVQYTCVRLANLGRKPMRP